MKTCYNDMVVNNDIWILNTQNELYAKGLGDLGDGR